jgi:hypothetical protein
MQIDLEEIKRMLNTFIESPVTFITLEDMGIGTLEDYEFDKFIGHFLLLVEGEYISGQSLNTGDVEDVGLIPAQVGYTWGAVPIRLTQKGHDFAAVLNQKPVLERLKKEAQDAPLSLLRMLGNALAEKYFIEKLGLGDK